MEMINNLTDLANYLGCNPTEESIAHNIFKYTDCGCCFYAGETFVSVSGYAEGSGDFECPQHNLDYPFSTQEWDDALSSADMEGCDAWEIFNEMDEDEQESAFEDYCSKYF